ncbi:MAG: DNA alkylation repair protein [Parabacteroides sp.]|nr:DNA alkylation repair protein [Parabacteroides sp.]
MTAAFILDELRSVASPEKAAVLQRFFKTGKGQYAEGDVFLGIPNPLTRNVAKANRPTPLAELQKLLDCPYHEARLAALVIMMEQYKKGSATERQALFDMYLRNTPRINNWDLVDVTCPHIVGRHLTDKDRSVLYKLAQSPLLWDQRIAIVSTVAFIRLHEYDDTFALSEMLLNHKHDLMHKAVGWMLREVGKRNKETLVGFLERNATRMPRTALRYAIEHFSPEERKHFMEKKK